VDGLIEFRNVTFSYPTRPSVKIMDQFSLRINPGEMVALVGPRSAVCVCVCVCVCVYVLCMFVCLYVCMYVCMYVFLR
jgi:ABC-type lipopolysaccharide export system ATPase subunit